MTKILLISEDRIKTESGLNDNIWGKSLLPAIREAQDMGLQLITGSELYKKLLQLVNDGSITASTNANYKTFLDTHIQPYLLYKVISNLIPILGTKISNLGTVVSNDEHTSNLNQSERDDVTDYYNYRADFYTKRMQEYLYNNYELFPELEVEEQDILPCLHSSTTTSLWLGGYRGKLL